MICQRCGNSFDADDAWSDFSAECFMLNYDNISERLCAECAIKAIEDEENDIYFETCECCGRRFDFIEENCHFTLEHGIDLRDIWQRDGRILCKDCAENW